MEKVIARADKEILAEVVRFAQKQGMKGTKGGWKDFLDHRDKKFGSNLSDPGKRSIDILAAFLRTFAEEEDIKFLGKVARSCVDRKALMQRTRNSPDVEYPEQRLVRLTIEHPQFVQHYSFPTFDKEWMVTNLGKVSKAMKSTKMIAIDCEMVLCEDGTEAVVKVCAVDNNLEVIIDNLVKPNKAIVDFRTEITGISAKDLEGITCSLTDIQKSLKKLLSHGTILVGHSLHNDLQALKVDHARVIDTQLIFKYQEAIHARPSLNNLCKSVLGCGVRKEGAPHNCLDDACAAMKLVLAKLKHGFDDPIAIETKNVPKADIAKLFLHKILVDVPSGELLKMFAEYNIVEVQWQLNSRARGHMRSAYAVFKDPKDAQEAFDNIEGEQEKDSSGRPQKLASMQLSTGATATFYVRKMTPDNLLSNKRSAEDEIVEHKKRKIDCNQCNHLTEIERLKQEIRQRDDEILNLQKILSALTRKHGL
ncbi:hypothetical protein AAC387_Pa01g4277 [Persea americana]